jgi:glutathione S-transferase
VASRIATYGLQLGADDMAYVAALLGHPSVRRWRAMAAADPYVQPQYEFDLPARTDAHPPPSAGRPEAGQAAENALCPFTGSDARADLQVEVQGRVFGFADQFTRDKVAADPLAWPEVQALLR